MIGIRRDPRIGLVALACAAAVALAGCSGDDQPAASTHPGDLAAVAKALDGFAAKVSPVVTGGAQNVPGPTFEVARAQPGARIEVRASPGGQILAVQGPKTEFGADRTFHVAGHRGDWLHVTSDVAEGNGLAWIRADPSELLITRTNYSLEADLSAQTVAILYGDRVVKRFPVTVGRAGNETPPGVYSVTDALAGEGVPPGFYGCCVMALTGHQPNLPAGWIGGDRIAIHGTPGGVGGAASSGCLRASDEDMAALFLLVPLGTPVFIRA
jgi:lipoprotein-anchoring transpeptidase ErfK/SrfK